MKTNKALLILLSLLAGMSCQKAYEITPPKFEVSAGNTVYKVGEPVVFNIKSDADIVLFYSGEFGNDYNYKDVDRYTPASMRISFDLKQTISGDAQTLNPEVLPISYSTDYNGEYTEESLDSAQWTDLTSRFTFPAPGYRVPVKNGSITTSNKSIDINDCFNEGKPIYLRFDYKVKKYDGTDKVGRTTVQFSNFLIQGHTEFDDILIHSIKDLQWGFVKRASWTGANDRSSLPGAQEMLTMNCEWNPSQDRELVAIAGPISKAEDVNSGMEASVPIKELSDPDITTYSHTYTKPGVYDVVFVAINTNVYGKKNVVKHIPVTIHEDKGKIIDPEEGDWDE